MEITPLENHKMIETSVSNSNGDKLFAPVLFENTIPFPFIEIEPKFKSQFIGYIQIFYDLQFVKKCLVYLSQIYNNSELDFIKQTVWESFIIKYAKCFTKAEGRKVKLEANDLYKNNSGQMEIHHELMELRHQHIAHGGNSKNEFIDSFFALHPDKISPPVGIYHQIKRAFCAGIDNINKYITVVNALTELVYQKIFLLQFKYQKELLESNKLEDLYKKAFYVSSEQT